MTLHGEWDEKLDDILPDRVFTVVVNEEVDKGRWNSIHDLVFVDNSTQKHYYVRYEKGLTESQYYEPFDNEREVECTEVIVTEKQVTYTEYTWVDA